MEGQNSQIHTHVCSGNRAYLLLVNSNGSWASRALADQTIRKYLDHFGVPYRLRDLASGQLLCKELTESAGVIIAQEGITRDLSPLDIKNIGKAIQDGAGMVNFDGDIRGVNPAWLELIGIGSVDNDPGAFMTMRTGIADHYITTLQDNNAIYNMKRPVSCTQARDIDKDVWCLAEGYLDRDTLITLRHLVPGSSYEPGNLQLLLCRKAGSGKAVQFLTSARIWHSDFFGPTSGLDDLILKSVAWAARKPFATNTIPRFLVMSFDDCIGRHQFDYVDDAVELGYTPMPSLFLREVPETLFSKVSRGAISGKASYNTHALDYYTLLTYDYGRGELSDHEIKERFAYETAWWNKVGVSQPKTMRFHWGEYGYKALPILKQTGRIFFNPAFQPGVMKLDVLSTGGFGPFNMRSYYYDILPDDPDYFCFASFTARHKEDFLTGMTPWNGEKQLFDAEAAAKQAYEGVCNSYKSGFYAELLTHEQKFDAVSIANWKEMLNGIERKISSLNTVKVSHDQVGMYLLARAQHLLTAAKTTDNGSHIQLVFRAVEEGALPYHARITEYRDDGYGVEERVSSY